MGKKNKDALCIDEEEETISPESMIDADNRIIFLHGDINNETCIYTIRAIKQFEQYKNDSTITIDINSRGGSLDESLSVINTISLAK